LNRYETMPEKELRFALWAALQDNLRRGDIIDRARDAAFRASVQENIERTEIEIRAMREEIARRTRETR